MKRNNWGLGDQLFGAFAIGHDGLLGATATGHAQTGQTKGRGHDFHEASPLETLQKTSSLREFVLDPFVKAGGFG